MAHHVHSTKNKKNGNHGLKVRRTSRPEYIWMQYGSRSYREGLG